MEVEESTGPGSRVRIRVKNFFFPNFLILNLRVSNMDGEDTAGLAVLEKKGLHQATGILENYGIDCETDVFLIDRDDFSKLVLNGLKPMEGKKLERWCNAVRARAENMMTSSLNTSVGAVLPSSESSRQTFWLLCMTVPPRIF